MKTIMRIIRKNIYGHSGDGQDDEKELVDDYNHHERHRDLDSST